MPQDAAKLKKRPFQGENIFRRAMRESIQPPLNSGIL
jgi:hypothetical protein